MSIGQRAEGLNMGRHKKYYEDVKIGQGFRVVIPITIRNLVGLRIGEKVRISLLQGNRIVIEKIKEEKE